MADNSQQPAGGQPPVVPEGGSEPTNTATVPYDRFRDVVGERNQTQEALKASEQREAALNARLEEIDVRMKELEARGPGPAPMEASPNAPASVDFDMNADPYLAQAIAPVNQKVDKVVATMERYNEYMAHSMAREAQTQADLDLQAHFAKREQDGLPLSDTAKTVMTKLYKERVVGGGVQVPLELVEDAARGAAQRYEAEARMAAAQQQRPGDPGLQHVPTPTGASVETAPTFPGGLPGASEEDRSDPWKTIDTTKTNWRDQWVKEYGKEGMKTSAKDTEEDYPFSDVNEDL